jgi:hypothetical protein
MIFAAEFGGEDVAMSGAEGTVPSAAAAAERISRKALLFSGPRPMSLEHIGDLALEGLGQAVAVCNIADKSA